MSNIDTFVDETPAVDAGIPENEAPDTVGQAGEQGEAIQEDDAFDVSQYGDKTVVVKVNGEEVRVPLSEALSGYQRQADYTRKTQELSRASALSEALEKNPEATLQLLQQTYGKQIGSQMAQAASASDPSDDWDADDPVAQEVRNLRAQVEELRGYETNRTLDSTLSGLKAKYGEHFNEQELIQAAAQRQIRTPGELESVFRDITFDKFFAVSQATEQHKVAQAAEAAARVAAKEGVSQVVSSGNGVAQTSTGVAAVKYSSFEDAFDAAVISSGYQ